MNKIGETLKYYRENAGLSQKQLERATGITQQKLSYYEAEKHAPSINDCIKLADFYGISLDELVGRSYGKGL
jgi:transcriptional regulator with XRE-family HTH domain